MNEPSDNHVSKSAFPPVDKDSGREPSRRDRKKNAATGASAAGVRALASQVLAFYFRAPAKAFFRARLDAFARAINPHFQSNEGYSLRISTPGLLSHAVKTYGWVFIPNHVIPPVLGNIGIGALLYTSYLQILGNLYEPSSKSLKFVYPPPPPQSTFLAGFAAGSIQSVVAAPLDALSVRFKTSEVLSGRYKTMWQYGSSKLREIGPRGIFAGWGLALIKDSMGYGAFFATFEYVKAQAYQGFVSIYYGDLQANPLAPLLKPRKVGDLNAANIIRPHWALAPVFLFLAGIAASLAAQIIQHPLSLVQNVHYKSLDFLDRQAKVNQPKVAMLRAYYGAYQKTFQQCAMYSRRAGGWRRWLYKGFLANSIKQVPSTSAGLVIFELVRRRYGGDSEGVKIEKDGYDILLT